LVLEDGHFGIDWGRVDGARFVFKTGNLQAMRHFMIQLGVRISPIFIGSNSIERFDFFDPYGTRLTVIRDRNLDSSVAGAVGLSMPIISVSDLEPSRAWYAKFLGMRRNGRKSVHGAYLMMGLWRFNGVRDPVVWLEEQNISDTIDQRVRPATRMYFFGVTFRVLMKG
jgi:hypothetical protein